MIPLGAVIPGTMGQWGATIGDLLLPASILGVLAMLVVLAVIIAGVLADSRASAGFERRGSGDAAASPPTPQGPRWAA